MTRTSRRPLGRGQALIEFALILPIFVLLTVGVVDLARIFSSYIALTDGVREAALYAAVGTNNTKWCSGDAADIACPPGTDPLVNLSPNADNIAYQIKSVGLDVSRVTMLAPVCSPSPCGATSETVKIEATYTMPFITPVLSNILGDTITVTARTTAQVLP